MNTISQTRLGVTVVFALGLHRLATLYGNIIKGKH